MIQIIKDGKIDTFDLCLFITLILLSLRMWEVIDISYIVILKPIFFYLVVETVLDTLKTITKNDIDKVVYYLQTKYKLIKYKVVKVYKVIVDRVKKLIGRGID